MCIQLATVTHSLRYLNNNEMRTPARVVSDGAHCRLRASLIITRIRCEFIRFNLAKGSRQSELILFSYWVGSGHVMVERGLHCLSVRLLVQRGLHLPNFVMQSS